MLRRLTKHEFAILLVWPVFASVLSLILDAQIYLSLFLFFGAPAIYLSFRHPELIRKSLFFSVIFSVPATFLVDYVMEFTHAWAIERMEVPQIWILQHVSFLQIIWLITYTYLVVIYYETFFDRSVSKVMYPRTKKLMLLGLGALGFVIFFHFFDQGVLYIDYFYLKIGLVGVLLPLLIFLIRTPSAAAKFFKVGTYFFFYTLLYELTALRLDQWSFPAKNQFIGYITLVGYSFPFEELFFWMMISSISILAYYEYFDDDGR
jgi:hypothetical protein